MDSEEVQLIYDYLHENYEYRDGELIAIKNTYGQRKGRSFGCVKLNPGNAYITAVLVINKNKYSFALSWFIYIFFNKKLPRYISHIDGNRFNNKMENLRECHKREINHKNGEENKGFYERNGRYLAYVNYKGNMLSLGSYASSEEARSMYASITSLIINKSPSRKEIKEFANSINPNVIISTKTGVPGVYLYKDKFKAAITVNGIFILLGYFDSISEAEEIYLKTKSNKQNIEIKPYEPKGFKYVKGRYVVVVTINKKRISLGSYANEEEARKIYKLANELIKNGLSHSQIKEKIKLINPNLRIGNKRGFPGVNFHKPTGKYYSRIQVNGKRIALGLHRSPEEAHAAYLKAKEEYKNEME